MEDLEDMIEIVDLEYKNRLPVIDTLRQIIQEPIFVVVEKIPLDNPYYSNFRQVQTKPQYDTSLYDPNQLYGDANSFQRKQIIKAKLIVKSKVQPIPVKNTENTHMRYLQKPVPQTVVTKPIIRQGISPCRSCKKN
jgi:hypothetical protein